MTQNVAHKGASGLSRPFGQRATAAVEFAILGPVLLLMVVMLFEIGLQATVAAALDYGARRAARLGVTGSIAANGPLATTAERGAALRNAVLSVAGGLLADARLTMDQASFNSAAAAAAGTGATVGPGATGQFVRYSLTYVQPLFTGGLAASVLQKTQFTHTATILVVNEPFPTK